MSRSEEVQTNESKSTRGGGGDGRWRGANGTDGSKMAIAGSATRRKFGENGKPREVSSRVRL
jgi:hypothetical protein